MANPDYIEIGRVCLQARAAHPEAHAVRPIWSNGRALAEVWTTPNSAFTYDPENPR